MRRWPEDVLNLAPLNLSNQIFLLPPILPSTFFILGGKEVGGLFVIIRQF
jgi:hypothetical protein